MTALCALAAGLLLLLVVPGCSAARANRLLRERAPRSEVALRPALLWAAPIVGMVLFGPTVGVAGGIGAIAVVHRMHVGAEPVAERRRRRRMAGQLPRTLDLVVAALASGQPPAAALDLVADVLEPPLAGDLAALAARLSVASDPRLVWDDVMDDPVLGPTGRAFRRAESSGMPVARVVREVAREQHRLQHAARREQGRRVAVKTAAPLGLCFLPAFFVVGVVPTVVGVFGGLDLGF